MVVIELGVVICFSRGCGVELFFFLSGEGRINCEESRGGAGRALVGWRRTVLNQRIVSCASSALLDF